MPERPAFCTSHEQMGKEVLHLGGLTASHTGKRIGRAVTAKPPSSQDQQHKRQARFWDRAFRSSNVSSCLVRERANFSFFIGLMCVSVHIEVYKSIFLINVLYFLA